MDLTYRTKVLQQWYMQLIKSCELYKKVSRCPKLPSMSEISLFYGKMPWWRFMPNENIKLCIHKSILKYYERGFPSQMQFKALPVPTLKRCIFIMLRQYV